MPIQDIFIALIHGISLLALLAIGFGVIERLALSRMARTLIQGLVFGCGGIIAMMAPAKIGDGMILDARALIVGFAAAFGGWPAALVAVAISGTYRLWLGGIGAMPGTVGIVSAALLGLFWRHYLKPQGNASTLDLMGLGLIVSAYLMPGLIMGQTSIATTTMLIAPYIVVSSVVASVLLGLFVDRELNQIAREQDWKTSALTDPLTALPNRRAFERGMEGLRVQDRQSALLIIDLDHFKVVNDTYGHAAGDYVLQQISMILRANMRNRDLLSRLGGEELAVLLPDTGAVLARQIAERLRMSIERLPIQWEDHMIGVTASFGASVAPGSTPSSTLFVQADAALYAAKQNGRNRVVFSGELALRPDQAEAAAAEATDRAA